MPFDKMLYFSKPLDLSRIFAPLFQCYLKRFLFCFGLFDLLPKLFDHFHEKVPHFMPLLLLRIHL